MSPFHEIGLYRRERFPLRLYLPLSCFLTSALMAVEPPGVSGWFRVGAVPLFLVLLFPFRLLEDLYSIEEDRRKDPGRVLCRTEELRAFRIVLVLAVLAPLGLLSFFHSLWQGVLYASLFWALHVWHVLASGIRSRWANGLLPLAKYPLLVLLVMSGPLLDWRSGAVMVLVFAAFVCYELLHDPRYGLPGRLVRGSRMVRFLPFAGALAGFAVMML